MNNSIEYNEGFLQCLYSLEQFIGQRLSMGVKNDQILNSIVDTFIPGRKEIQTKQINDIIDDMCREYQKDKIK